MAINFVTKGLSNLLYLSISLKTPLSLIKNPRHYSIAKLPASSADTSVVLIALALQDCFPEVDDRLCEATPTETLLLPWEAGETRATQWRWLPSGALIHFNSGRQLGVVVRFSDGLIALCWSHFFFFFFVT